MVHVGDLFETRCTRERYQRSLSEFNGLPHPVIYTPGDNEWTDCWSHNGLKPLDRVLGIHGDWHDYTVDRPLTRRSTGQPLDNFTRLQVPGSPDIGWVRITVTPDAAEPFAFEPRVIPFWR